MKYLVKLKPLDKFFFGREQTFEEDNYFAKSALFPQQTQLLGMLRKEILIQNSFLTQKRRGEWVDKPKAEEAKKYVGAERFKLEAESEQDFGAIHNISELFLIDKDDNLYYLSAKDDGLRLEGIEENLPKLKFLDTDNLYTEKESKKLTPKIFSSNKEYEISDIFTEDTQIGIAKGRDGATDDNAFFKKTSYKLNPDFNFAFVLELHEEPHIKLTQSIVTLGGERSLFKMELENAHILCDSYKDEIKKLYMPEKASKLILLSDTYIPEDSKTIFSFATFAITDSVAVKTIDSKVTKWKKKSKDIENYFFTKSKKIYNFFKRGSVFYAPQKELKALINKNENLQKIGYNKYTILEGETK